jgi:hypothetical protein
MVRRWLLTGAVAALSLASAQADETIVVTAVPLSETEAKLAACLAQGCAPDADIAATLAHAENQFIAGKYGAARSTLVSALARNRQHKAEYPVPVSDLLGANGRVAEHMGEARAYKTSVLGMRDVLRDAFGAEAPRVLAAQIEVGDSRAKLGYPDEAHRIYGEVEDRARAARQPRIAAFAQLRRGALAVALANASKLPEDRVTAAKSLRPLADNSDPQFRDFRLAANVLTARMASRAGDKRAIAALVADFAAEGGAERPVLLFEPSLVRRPDYAQLPNENFPLSVELGIHPNAVQTGRPLRSATALLRPDEWADIGFWVGADGRVTDAEVLRASGPEQWTAPVLTNVAERVYAPLKRTDGDVSPGHYLIERYTLTATWVDDPRGTTGTRLRRRETVPRIERIDITPDTPVQVAAR